jgi:hypothetical protein
MGILGARSECAAFGGTANLENTTPQLGDLGLVPPGGFDPRLIRLVTGRTVGWLRVFGNLVF